MLKIGGTDLEGRRGLAGKKGLSSIGGSISGLSLLSACIMMIIIPPQSLQADARAVVATNNTTSVSMQKSGLYNQCVFTL